jgi:hypothetical protein
LKIKHYFSVHELGVIELCLVAIDGAASVTAAVKGLMGKVLCCEYSPCIALSIKLYCVLNFLCTKNLMDTTKEVFNLLRLESFRTIFYGTYAGR